MVCKHATSALLFNVIAPLLHMRMGLKSGVTPRGKIGLQKVHESLTTTCPKCGRIIQPSEIRRVNFEEMICPECGAPLRRSEDETVETVISFL
jgi:predicted RNA-binding Zn-ribbon protein involved in translation (DUF1610 family)